MKLTVFYDGQYWVGVVEDHTNGRLKAGKYFFGSEPNDQEILLFVQKHLCDVLNRMSQEVDVQLSTARKVNPKRLARLAARELKMKGISSYAEEVLKLEHEKRKKERKVISRKQREETQQRKREIRIQKAKAKHRGK